MTGAIEADADQSLEWTASACDQSGGGGEGPPTRNQTLKRLRVSAVTRDWRKPSTGGSRPLQTLIW